MKFLFLFLISIVAQANLRPEQIQFKYQSFDGQVYKKCFHQKENEWFDWTVECEEKKFSVHLSLRRQQRLNSPKTSFEVLYWITNRTNSSKLESSGSSIWFHLKDLTNFESITLSQSTDKDTAGLYLDIKSL